MSLTQISGDGLWLGLDPRYVGLWLNGVFTSAVIDATGEKMVFQGRAWFAGRTGTKAIRRVGFRFGTVTKAGGSALTISLQDVSGSAGPPGQPDETQDQTVAVANADAAFASNTWYRSGALSADRTVAYGDTVAIVIEFDGSGRLGSDAVNFSLWPAGFTAGISAPVLKTGSFGVISSVLGNCVLEFSDGTFGRLEMNAPIKAFNSHSYNSGSTPDEHALRFRLPAPAKVDGLRVLVGIAGSSSDFDVVLYDGTTQLVAASVDAAHIRTTFTPMVVELPVPETSLAANTTYYVAIKPTSANNVTAYSFDVDDANQLAVHAGGTDWHYATRTDGGSWTPTTTRQLVAGIRVSSIDDGGGGGSSVIVVEDD